MPMITCLREREQVETNLGGFPTVVGRSAGDLKVLMAKHRPILHSWPETTKRQSLLPTYSVNALLVQLNLLRIQWQRSDRACAHFFVQPGVESTELIDPVDDDGK